MSLPP